MLTKLLPLWHRVVFFTLTGVLSIAFAVSSGICAPPPVPEIKQSVTSNGQIAIRFYGKAAETAVDANTSRVDFEGYRVYVSPSPLLADFVQIASRDFVNFLRYKWQVGVVDWVLEDPPLLLDSLKTLYDALTDSAYGFAFSPDSFMIADIAQALREIKPSPSDSNVLDTSYYYFEGFGENYTPDDIALSQQVDSLGLDVFRVIRKAYPYAYPEDSVYWPDGNPFAPFYYYEFALDSLNPDTTIYVSVTAFDHGDPQTGASPEESSILDNVIALVPSNVSNRDIEVQPSAISLQQNFPNPFNAGTSIRFVLESAVEVELSIYNLLGRRIATVASGVLPAGTHEYRWNGLNPDADDYPSGTYLYLLKTATQTQAKRMLLLK